MSTTLAYILGIVILVIGIGVSVALHELGHMIPAKKFGVKVPEYFIGFGPKIWSFRRGETEYGVKAIWLGGYVSSVGMPASWPGPAGRTADARTEAWAWWARHAPRPWRRSSPGRSTGPSTTSASPRSSSSWPGGSSPTWSWESSSGNRHRSGRHPGAHDHAVEGGALRLVQR